MVLTTELGRYDKFDEVLVPALSGGKSWQVNYNDYDVTLAVVNNLYAPVANNDSYDAYYETDLFVDAAYGVLANDTDADGNLLTAVIDSNPSDGSLTLNADGSFLYTPDNGFDGTDSFTYKAYDGANYSSAATVTIEVDAGSSPTLSIGDVTGLDEDEGTAVFTVTVSASSNSPVYVDYTTDDGSAEAPADYATVYGTAVIEPGQTTTTIEVPIFADGIDEPSETFVVDLSNADNATISDSEGEATITDVDDPPTISISDAADIEGINLTFTVSLSGPSGKVITVDYATGEGTAINEYSSEFYADFYDDSDTLTFAPGQTVQTVVVAIEDDGRDEYDETLTVDLDGESNATIADGEGVGTIIDNDAPPTISIDDAGSFDESGIDGDVTFTVSLSTESEKIVTVTFSTANGSAVDPDDYLSNSNVVTFSPLDVEEPVTISITDDSTYEEYDENFYVNLSSENNATIVDGQGEAWIIDDDEEEEEEEEYLTLNLPPQVASTKPPAITLDDLKPLIVAAMARWEAVGVDGAALAC